MPSRPEIDPTSALLFIINAASGSNDEVAKRAVIESALASGGRIGDLRFTAPDQLAQAAHEAAAMALQRRTALIAVGGDGTINTVAQAAHAVGCAMGVLAQGTFNYFARTHGLSTEPAVAAQALLLAAPQPIQVGEVNGRIFLVNASLGLYPEMLENREDFKSRFGRYRVVALASAAAMLMHERKQLLLQIERGGVTRDVRTPTLFIGNNRLQLEQIGLSEAPALDSGSMAAVMLRPIGTRSMLWLLLRGAFGSLGGADDIESFEFQRMIVKPRLTYGRQQMKIAFDGEVTWMHAPLEFRVSPTPLYLLKPIAEDAQAESEPSMQ